MEIDSLTYDWLKSLRIMSGPTKVLENQKVMIDREQAKLFQNGFSFGKILAQYTAQGDSLHSDLERIKNLPNPAARVVNWGIIASAFKHLRFHFDNEIKSLIISGDIDLIADILKDLKDHFSTKQHLQQPTNNNIRQKEQSVSQPGYPQRDQHDYQIDYFENQSINRDEYNAAPNQNKGQLDISLVDVDKRLNECNSLLELIIVSLSKNLTLKPKQVLGLLANNNKYLAVGLVKGMKTSFTPLIDWLQNVYVNIKTVMKFIEHDNQSLYRFLDLVKPALQSSNEQIALWASRILAKVAFEVSTTDILPQTYAWFVKENGGLKSCVLCLSRHKSIKSNVVQIITIIARHNLSDLFIVQLRNIFDSIEEYISYISLIFPSLLQIDNYKEELISNRIIPFWIEQAQKMAEDDPIKNSVNCRQIGLGFLCECWITYPNYVSETLLLTNRLLDILKKAQRGTHDTLKFHSIALLFHLLDSFAQQKNANTALIYKKLVFSLIENSSDIKIREFILRNFISSFKKFVSMPPDILLDPFIKQIQLRSQNNIFTPNICDIEFFNAASIHGSINLRTSIQMMDMLSKMYLNELVWSQSLLTSMRNLIERFIENEPFQEYLKKLSEVALEIIRDSYKRLLKQPSRFAQEYVTEQEQVIVEAQRRALIVELLRIILDFRVMNLNNQIKSLLAETQQELLSSSIQYKGIFTLLSFFGDPNAIVETHKQEQLAKKEDFDYELFEMQQNKKKSQQYQNQQQQQQQQKEYGNGIQPSGVGMKEFRNLSADDNLKNYLKSENTMPKKMDWNSVDQYESLPTIKQPKMNNNYTYNSIPLNDMDKSPAQTNYTNNNNNAKGPNRMDFSQYENTLLQAFMQKEKQKMSRGRELSQREKPSATQEKSNSFILERRNSDQQSKFGRQIKKPKYTSSLERRKDELDQIREKRENKILLNELQRMQQIQKQSQLKKQTENEVNKIITKLNVPKAKQSDQPPKLIYRENELDTLSSLNKYEIIDIDGLEQRDQETLEIVLKQFSTALKFIFTKYSNTHKSFGKNADLFADKKQVAELIQFSDIWNFCKDYELSKFITKEDVQVIMKQVNSNPQFNFLKYTDFILLFIQMSIFMFRKPPKDLRGLPIGNTIQECFKYMGLISKRKGENPTIFENPECYSSNLDVHTLKLWNSKLARDPEIQLPEHLKKVTEKSYQITNEFQGKHLIGLSQGYMLAYEIIADILKEKLGINLIENAMKIVPLNIVRPKPIPRMFEKGRLYQGQQAPASLQIPSASESFALNDQSKSERSLGILKGQNSPSPILKLQQKSAVNIRENSKAGGANKTPDNQYQAMWMQKYSQYGLAGINKQKGPIINQAIQDKQRKEEEESKRKESHNKRVRDRQAELLLLKKDLEEHKQKREQEKKDNEMQSQLEKEKELARLDNLRKQQLKKKEELKLFKQQESMKKLQEKEDVLRVQLEAETNIKRQMTEKKQKQSAKLNQHLEQIKEKLQAQVNQKQKEQEKAELEKKSHQTKNEKTHEKERKRKEAAAELKQKFEELQTNPDVLKVFQNNSKITSMLFNMYKAYKDQSKGSGSPDLLSYRGFSHICSHFKLFGQAISTEDAHAFFRAEIRDNKDGSQGIRQDQLEHIFLKICVKAQPVFQKVSSEGQGENSNQQLNQEQKQSGQKDQSKSSELDINNIINTNDQTIEGFFQYLNLPSDKMALVSKIKLLIGGDNQKEQEQAKNPPMAINQNQSFESSPKKYPKSKKYKNVQSRLKKNENDKFTNVTSSSITRKEID